MSSYCGNHHQCPTCGLAYGEFRTGLSYQEVFVLLMDNSDDPSDWRNKTRHTVLGKWHEIKKLWWELHLEQCKRQKEFEDEACKGDAWECDVVHSSEGDLF